jgi:amino-acid N-acetyltransferase
MSPAEPAWVVRPATPRDHAPVIALLEGASLPTAGVELDLADFLIAEKEGRIAGAIGLEPYGNAALLRSAVVDSDSRGTGVGRALVERLLANAKARGVREVYLLTTTAEQYFHRNGFVSIGRDQVPTGVRESVEFREACPASAVVMRKVLTES